MEDHVLSRILKRKRGTVAVGAIAIIFVFMIVLTCIGVVVMESNRYSGNVKYANEAAATKARESLAVVQASSTLVNVTNEGSTPVVIIGFYRVNPADNNPNYVPLSNPATVPLLSSAPITLPQATPENWKVGVVTSLGNVFWEEQPVQGGAIQTVPPGEPVYVTFTAQGLGSDASGTVLTADGSAYAYSQLPKTFQWVSGSTHSFSWSSPVSGSSGVRYVWASTSGLSTKQSDSSFTVNANGYVIAAYRTQYSLTMKVNPSGGGTTNPAPGTYWYDPGSTVQISATASSGYAFTSWAGSGSGSYTGTANPATITMNGPITETAVFTVFSSWLTGWSYRRPITITSTTSLSNYQILVQADTALLISAGKMRSDGGDIRFTDSDGVTLLSYWIEPGTINTANTRIWVKVPSIPSGTKTAYVYYGNPSATSQSNGDNTFLLFDDFLGTTLNTNKWNVNYYANPSYGWGTASYSVANGELVLYAPRGSYRAIIVSSVQTFGQSEIRMKVYPSTFATYNTVYLWGAVYSIPTSGIGGHLWDKGYAWDVDDYNHHRFEYYSSSLSYVNVFIDTNYHVYFAKYIPSSQIVEGYDTTTENTLTTNIPNTTNKVFFECGTTTWYAFTDQYLHIDWVFVKNYASSEPSVVLGSEET